MRTRWTSGTARTDRVFRPPAATKRPRGTGMGLSRPPAPHIEWRNSCGEDTADGSSGAARALRAPGTRFSPTPTRNRRPGSYASLESRRARNTASSPWKHRCVVPESLVRGRTRHGADRRKFRRALIRFGGCVISCEGDAKAGRVCQRC